MVPGTNVAPFLNERGESQRISFLNNEMSFSQAFGRATSKAHTTPEGGSNLMY
jgi:hypothetical protein